MTIQSSRWEPSKDGGSRLGLTDGSGHTIWFELSGAAVRELAADMTEAVMVARGYDKVDIVAENVQPLDTILMGGRSLIITNILSQRFQTVLQTQHDDQELVLDNEMSITVWRTAP